MKFGPDHSCMKCGLCDSADTVCLFGNGPLDNAKAMIIGEAPGRDEDAVGEPFVGRSGSMLDDMLKDAGLPRSKVYVTNAVKCRPPENREPSKKEVATCRDWLMMEIERLQPQFIMTLGNTPLTSLLGLKGIKKLRGKPIEIPGKQLGVVKHDIVYVFPAYHPSYALRDPRNEPVLRQDIAQFAKIIARGGPRAEPGLKCRIIIDRDDLEECLEDIAANDVVSYDCETSGLNPFAPGSYVTSLGIGTKETQWCLPLQHPQGPLYRKLNTQKRWAGRIVDACQDKIKVGQNGKFDTLFLRVVFGLEMDCDFDTMLAHYNIDENSYHGLDHLASQYYGAIDYDISLSEKHGFGPLQRHCEYLALDLYYTRKLYYDLNKQLVSDPATERLFYGLTMPVSKMYADIEFNGVYVDPQALNEAHGYWSEIADTTMATLHKLVPDDRVWKDSKTKEKRVGINWNSADQVAEVLFNRLGLKPLDMTAGGKSGVPKPSVAESVLLRLADKHEVPKLVITLREAMKNRGTFVEGWRAACYSENKMHPTFKIHGTVTGRPSCVDPNLQQTPRDQRIRSMIRAPKGWVLADADLSQAELRIAAEMSGDRELRLSYQTGVDVHTLTVQRIFNIMKPDKEQRKRGKAINFGFLYGMGWKKFKIYAFDNYGVEFSDAECKQAHKGFFRLYSGLPDWHKRQRRFAKANGYVRSLLGRKRRLPDAQLSGNDPHSEMRRAEAERQAINSPVQSMASDINLMAAVELFNELPRSYFRLSGTVHDSILMWIREDMVDKVVPRIKQAMEQPKLLKEWSVRMGVPIVSEVELGPWGGMPKNG